MAIRAESNDPAWRRKPGPTLQLSVIRNPTQAEGSLVHFHCDVPLTRGVEEKLTVFSEINFPLLGDAHIGQVHGGDSFVAQFGIRSNLSGFLEHFKIVKAPSRSPAPAVGAGLGEIGIPQLLGRLLLLVVDSDNGDGRADDYD